MFQRNQQQETELVFLYFLQNPYCNTVILINCYFDNIFRSSSDHLYGCEMIIKIWILLNSLLFLIIFLNFLFSLNLWKYLPWGWGLVWFFCPETRVLHFLCAQRCRICPFKKIPLRLARGGWGGRMYYGLELTDTLDIILIIQKRDQTWSADYWALVVPIHSKCIPHSWDAVANLTTARSGLWASINDNSYSVFATQGLIWSSDSNNYVIIFFS